MKAKKLFATCLTATLLCISNLPAQEANQEPQKKAPQRPTTEERIAKQTEFMQQRLLLDEKTAAQFAPIYKEYLNELNQCKPQLEKPEQGKKLTDAEIEKRIESQFSMQKKRIETQEAYYNKLKKVLNAKQLEQIFRPNACGHKHMNGKATNGMEKRFGKRHALPQQPPKR